MNVILISSTFDIGGQGHRIVQAFRHLAPDWVVRSLVKVQSYLGYPIDLPFRRATLEEQYQAADVIHVRNDFAYYDQMAAKFGPKPVLIHHQGTAYRSDPNRHIRERIAHNAIGLVSTLDLWLLDPEGTEWLPAPIDVNAMQELRRRSTS